jgi:predicted nucleotidyltransferase
MKNSGFDQYKDKVILILKMNGVKKAALFGSFARREATKSSDIDLLIEFKGKKSLFDLVDLKYKLEESTGRNVDLVTFKSLHPLLKDKISSEQITIL